MLAVVEEFHKSDVGLQRRINEDSLFARAPLFAVADGMGGAQAGEVASSLAVQSLERALAQDGSDEQRLAERVREANLHIYELSQSDVRHAGMGTTLTAALLGEDEIAIAHVGDSRAYLFRDGELERLTRDHSLVGELVRRGKLTEAEAEEHPQRSIITRALGPEGDVEVDTRTYSSRSGDTYLLCSDGLTAMISDQQIAELLSSGGSLAEVGQQLIDAANQAGGKDNITVVLLRLDEVSGVAPPADEGADQPTTVGAEALRASDVQAALEQQAAPRSPRQPRSPLTLATAKKRSRARRAVTIVLVTLAVLSPFVVAGWLASRAVYFIGTDQQGFVTVYRGVPYELPLGIKLYQSFYVSGSSVDQLTAGRRRTLLDHRLRSQDDAKDLVRKLERGQLR